MNKSKIVLGAMLMMAMVVKPAMAVDANTPTSLNFFQQLAIKLGLSQTKVQTAFEDVRVTQQKERQAQMQAKYLTNLEQLVKDGKITQEQKNLITAKYQELITKRIAQREENLKNRQELQDWATKNGIDPSYVVGNGRMQDKDEKFGGRMGSGQGMMGRGFGRY